MSRKQLNVIFASIFYHIAPVLNAPLPPDDDDGSSSPTENRRSLWSIPWSCLVTIVACTWLSVHPNVPGRKLTESGRIATVIDRVKTMAIAVLAPEVIVAWAASQFIVAWKICYCCCYPRKDTYPSKLTMTHGFFLSMGGFYEEGTKKIITLETLKADGILTEKLATTGEPIRDKSKADAFSKILSILQIAWFITQCMARANQHLPVTLLEVTALAFAVSSIIASLLWFYKPLNVRYAIGVTVPTPSTPITRQPTDNTSTPTDDPTSTARPPTPAETTPPPCTIDVQERVGVSPSSSTPQSPTKNTPAHSDKPTSTAPPRMIKFLMERYSILLGAGRDGTPEVEVDDGVPRFWSGGTAWSEVSSIRAPTILAVGVLFGAIHCAAWSFSFPSYAEMMLWRFSSVAVLIGLVGPLLPFIDGFRKAVAWIHEDAWNNIKSTAKRHLLLVSFIVILVIFLAMMLLFGLFVYTAGRLILIVLAFMELRSLQLSSLDTVQWTTYMPHI
ncbi:hypothetical protein EDD18DRAFT_1283203 [Armillaria luteobubalina]|uniref:Uncharacterized protein n=1 Tax=Armillaria luteobubalina TaxID=153913 RepID=A0AA39QAF0_9AGAR|nr:hypothetical protein EDD18DRAFT_1283203 [Armillaria luteobubalina]